MFPWSVWLGFLFVHILYLTNQLEARVLLENYQRMLSAEARHPRELQDPRSLY